MNLLSASADCLLHDMSLDINHYCVLFIFVYKY